MGGVRGLNKAIKEDSMLMLYFLSYFSCSGQHCHSELRGLPVLTGDENENISNEACLCQLARLCSFTSKNREGIILFFPHRFEIACIEQS